MATATPTPDLPSRHPGRVYRIETDLSPPQNLSDKIIDLWEHATLLFYGYQWHASAENFLYLSSIINQQFESAQCLLNSAIIFANLGDYNVASEALEGAAMADEFQSLALYLLGHVEFELGNLQDSEQCFKAALATLRESPLQFGHLGLDFVLDAAMIEHNLTAFDIQSVSLASIPDLGTAALPVGSVFESPQRTPDSGYASPHSPTKSIDAHQFEADDHEQPAKRTPKALLAQTKHASPDVIHTQSLRSLEYSKGNLQWHEPTSPSQEQSAPLIDPRRSIRSIGGLVRQISARRKQSIDSKSNLPTTSPRSRLLARLVPREAKIKDDSTRDLAGFIRNLPPQEEPAEASVRNTNHQHRTNLAEVVVESEAPDPEPHTPTDSRSFVSADSNQGNVDLEDMHVDSRDFVDGQQLSDDEDITDNLEPPPKHPLHSTMDHMKDVRPEFTERTSSSEVRKCSQAPSVKSSYTDNMSIMADDEASDSGNDTDHNQPRSVTPTRINRRSYPMQNYAPQASQSSMSTLG